MEVKNAKLLFTLSSAKTFIQAVGQTINEKCRWSIIQLEASTDYVFKDTICDGSVMTQ